MPESWLYQTAKAIPFLHIIDSTTSVYKCNMYTYYRACILYFVPELEIQQFQEKQNTDTNCESNETIVHCALLQFFPAKLPKAHLHHHSVSL